MSFVSNKGIVLDKCRTADCPNRSRIARLLDEKKRRNDHRLVGWDKVITVRTRGKHA
jgi:hypothetical protein